MERLTHRSPGRLGGYYSGRTKNDLIQRLGEYEDSGRLPEDIPVWFDASLYAPVSDAPVIVTAVDKDGVKKVVQATHSQEHGWITFVGLKVIAWCPMPRPWDGGDPIAES